MNKLIKFTIFSLFGILLTGCYKINPTVVNIQVFRIADNGDEIPVNNAKVRLFAYGSTSGGFIGEPRFDDVAETTANGMAYFDYTEYYKPGQTGFVVLDIEAEKGALYGEGIVEVVEMETNYSKVIIE